MSNHYAVHQKYKRMLNVNCNSKINFFKKSNIIWNTFKCKKWLRVKLLTNLIQSEIKPFVGQFSKPTKNQIKSVTFSFNSYKTTIWKHYCVSGWHQIWHFSTVEISNQTEQNYFLKILNSKNIECSPDTNFYDCEGPKATWDEKEKLHHCHACDNKMTIDL